MCPVEVETKQDKAQVPGFRIDDAAELIAGLFLNYRAKRLMAKQSFETDVKEAMQRCLDKIREGESSAEVIKFYQRMAPRDFSLWLHGFFLGLCQDKIWISSELYRFLKRQLF